MDNEFIYIQKSKIPGAGNGVFSKKKIKSGKKLGEYKVNITKLIII